MRATTVASAVAVGALFLWCSAGGALGAPKPDLLVTSVSDPPASVRTGDTFTLSAPVQNVGQAAAGPSTTKFYLVAGSTKKNLKGVQPIASLAPDESAGEPLTIGVYSDTPPGTYNLQACADGDGDISEADEANNCKTAAASVTVEQSPDLIVSSLSNPPSSGAQGQPITVKNTIKNVGEVNADPSMTKYFLVSTVDNSRQDLKGSQSVPLLKPGQTFNSQESVTIRPETSPGQYKLQACADSLKVNAETDENNNCLTATGSIQVAPSPDLVVTSVTVPGLPQTVLPGASLSPITVVVANLGLAQAKSSTMKFVLVDTVTGAQKNLNGTQSIPAVSAQGTATVQKTVTVTSDTVSGTYQVQACADSGKVVAETFESNNCGSADALLTVQGLVQSHADLVVTSVTDPPVTALPGDAFTVTAIVANQGTDPAPASTTAFYLVNTATAAKKNLKGGQSVAPLAPGASDGPPAAISLYSDTLPGTYFLQACADGAKGLAEQVESNNCTNAAGTILVPPKPNLVVSAVGNHPTAVPLEGSFTFLSSVKNVATGGAGPSTTRFYLVSTADGSRLSLKGTQIVPALNAGQTFSNPTTLVLRTETLPGSYNLQACADDDTDVAETKEDDNCLTASGTIKVTLPPDLVVTALTVRNAPLTVARGASLTVTVTVKNVGEADAAASSTALFLVDGAGATTGLVGPVDAPLLHGNGVNTVTRTVTVAAATAVGTYTVRACADGTSHIAEGSETNNCITTTTTVTVQ